MSAVNPLPSSAASAERKPYEPSMEEILASIRRIIADDQSLPGRTPAREPEATPQPAVEAPPLSDEMVTPTPAADVVSAPAAVEADIPPAAGQPYGHIAAPQFPAPDAQSIDRPAPTPAHEPEPEPWLPGEEAVSAAVHEPETADIAPEPYDGDVPVEPEPLRLRDRDPAVDVVPAPDATAPLFSAATDTSVSSAFNMLAASRLADNSDELMTLAREMIRPLLRSWIDDNLPSMVERMVRAEIERVARGGR